MQRLFSMFPAGVAGAALLILRVSVAASLVTNGFDHWTPKFSLSIVLALFIVAALVCLGFLTPYCAALACCVQTVLLTAPGGTDQFHSLISVVDSGALAGLGPGAYSIDAHVFGRRIVRVPARR